MSIHEIEAKARELRQLQQLIEEATAEAEVISDQGPHGRGRGAAGRGVQDHLEVRNVHQAGQQGPESRRPRAGGAVHPHHHHPPLLRGMKKAPCINADQSQMQEASTSTGTSRRSRGAGMVIILYLPPEIKNRKD